MDVGLDDTFPTESAGLPDGSIETGSTVVSEALSAIANVNVNVVVVV